MTVMNVFCHLRAADIIGSSHNVLDNQIFPLLPSKPQFQGRNCHIFHIRLEEIVYRKASKERVS